MPRMLARCLPLLLCLPLSAAAAAPGDEANQIAGRILRATGVEGGIIVHLGCGDGRLTAALYAHDGYLVQGLDTDPEDVAAARRYIQSLGKYGPVSADRYDGSRLPYVDDLVNLVVVQGDGHVPMGEVMRVLCHRGIAYVERNGAWEKAVKPWPDDIDEWTHFLHDASNNAVAQDTRVGPPRRLKWKCGPLWSRSHEFICSVPAMVSAGGRLFYVVDEGLTSVTDERLPERWMLVGRDAFNGVLLWKRPLPDWRGDEWKNVSMRGRPPSVPRRIVGGARSLYATLSHRGPLAVLDPATGKTLRTIEGTANTQEILLWQGTLILRLAPLGTRRQKPSGSIVAVDAETGQVLWRAEANRYLPQSLAASDGRVVYSTGNQTVCLALADGKGLWRQSPADGKRAGEILMLHGNLVLEGDAAKIVARSADTGKILWTTASRGGSMRGQDLFVAQGCVWHASADGITGYDLATGKAAKVIDPSCVQSPGHHLRCYRAKATERFLITQFRGAEFLSLTDDNHTNNDWVRGTCRYGVMPSGGLLYVPPDPCFCYPGAKLTGLVALAPELPSRQVPRDVPDNKRLEKGPAYGQATVHHSSFINHHSSDWPTYRHDPQRSGATLAKVPAQLSRQWQVSLQGPLTPPVACEGRVYVAAKERHTLHVLDAAAGRPLWRFTAGGRIDSPPTVHAGLVLFGCADGAVYCLRAVDGELVWRFRAAPSEEKIVAFNQLESPWRVHGSVLLKGGLAYLTAGRSTFLDGGIWIFALDPETGSVVHQTHLDTWAPTRQHAAVKPFIPSYHIEGTHSDVLVGQGDHIYLGQYKLDARLAVEDAPYVMRDPDNPVVAMDITKEGFTAGDPDLDQGFEHFRSFHRYVERAHPELAQQYKQKFGGMNLGDRKMGLHLVATAGFLDDAWFNRTYWMYSANWPGWYHAHRGAKSGQLLVVGPEKTYAVQAFPTRNRQSPLFTPGDKGYLLLADHNDTEPVLDDLTRGATKGMGYTRLEPPVWYDWVPIRIRAMVLAADHLFVAGPPDVVDPHDPWASFYGRKGGLLRVYRKVDGQTLAQHKLDAPPVFDGLIAAEGRLLICTTDSQVVCLAENK